MEIIREQKYIGPTAAALGYFDGVHRGHLAVLEAAGREAAARGIACAAFSLDMTAMRAEGKGEADIFPEDVRLAELGRAGAARCVVLPFEQVQSYSGERFVSDILVGVLDAAVVVCGADFRFGRGRSCGVAELRELCAVRNIAVHVVNDASAAGERVSASRIKAALVDGNLPDAEAMLGREYGFALPVYEEKQLARKLGFPTINQRFPTGIITPRFGVYYSIAVVDGRRMPAVSNLGVRPTVEDWGRVTLETHILDYSGDLYGQTVPVYLKRFLREEHVFEDTEALRRVVQDNIAEARALAQKDT